MSRPTTPQSPTLQEQLEERRKQFRLKEPTIVEGQRRKSQRQDAMDRLRESDRLRSLGKGGRKSRKMRKSRRRLTRRRR
jgi:hypothetical protein